MAHELLLPQWSMGMHEGKILKWLKQVGDPVTDGEIIAEVESSKVVSELMADRDGVLLKLLVAEEEEVPVRTALCLIGEPGESVAESEPAIAYVVQPPSAPVTDNAVAGSVSPAKAQVTPPARKLAKLNHIDLSQIAGSGPGGRVVVEDVEAVVSGGSGESFALTGLRATIAANMTQSLQQAAQLTLTSEVDVAALVELRKTVSASYGDMIGFALSRVLPNHPRFNAQISAAGDRVRLIKKVNLGFAVALDEGLVVPVIHGANGLSLAQIAEQSAVLARRAKSGDLAPADLTDGSFTISNLGGYGVDAFTPIINPAQVAILGVGRIRERPVKLNGELAWQSTAVLSLTFDHRITDGAPAAKLLQALAEFVGDRANFS